MTYQLAGHMRGPPARRGVLDIAASPRIAAMADAPPFNWDEAFDKALEALVNGLVGGRSSTDSQPRGRRA